MKNQVLPQLQFVIAFELMGGSRSGIELRESLTQQGFKKSLAAFYQVMSRMEESKLVKGAYSVSVDGGQTIKERRYELTPNGIARVNDTQAFYARSLARLGLNGV